MQICKCADGEREISEPDMNFTRDGLGKNMGSSRERHEKHMGSRCVPHLRGVAHVK